MSAMSPAERAGSTHEAEHQAWSMYRFLEYSAGQYMTRSVITVTHQVTLRDLKALFDKHDFNSFPVVEGRKMVGIVTKFDFLKAFVFTTNQMVPHYDDLMQRPVQQIMTESVSSIEPTTPLTRVLELMGYAQSAQPSSSRRSERVAGRDLSRRRDASARRGDAGGALRRVLVPRGRSKHRRNRAGGLI
jgi:CBS domain-containing protein